MNMIRSVILAASLAVWPVLAVAAAAENTAPLGALPAPAPEALEAFKADIRKLYDMKERAFAEGNADLVVNHFYSANATAVGPDGKPYQGRAAFLQNYKEVVAKYNVKIESVNTYVDGNSGWDWTNFHVTSKDGSEEPFTFVILFLWNKVDGKWACTGDMYVVGGFPKEG